MPPASTTGNLNLSALRIRDASQGPHHDALIVYLKERTLKMLRNDLIQRNPMGFFGDKSERSLAGGEFGGILARAGVGKTALIVQLAINAMLKDQRVLHISLTDPVNKVNLWYQEVYRHLTRNDDATFARALWEELLPCRFIMTFKAEGFKLPVLEERLGDLGEQGIFSPSIVIFDGYPFDAADLNSLAALKTFCADNDMSAWFTIRTHRHEAPAAGGLPTQLNGLDDLFDALVRLQPEGKEIHIEILKGVDAPPSLVLDPTTMLIANEGS